MRTLKIAVPGYPEKTKNYFAALQALGAEPVIVGADCDPDDFDGLLLPGGGDVDPVRFGEENNGSRGIDPALDDLQFTVLERFCAVRKPVLGICRGHQLINIYFGGTLIQDLPQAKAHLELEDGDNTHRILAKRGSFLYALFGEAFTVNSSHHQGNGKPGKRIDYIAYSEDGVVEALVHRDFPVWGVQFHPERMCFAKARPDTVDGSSILKFFLEECAAGPRDI